MGSPWTGESVFHPPPKLRQQCKGKENWNLQHSNTDKVINGFVLKALVLNSDCRDIYTPISQKHLINRCLFKGGVILEADNIRRADSI